jgi:glycosyltransferase involved in cell wall biosynthesis
VLPALLGVPVVTTVHEYAWWAWPSRRVPGAVWGPLERSRLWDRETLLLGARSAELLVTNPAHAEAVRARLCRTPRLVPIGPNVPDAGLSREEARARVTSLWGVPPTAPLLAFFGFVHPVKGVRYLLDAMALLRERNLRLVVAGGFESLALPAREAAGFRAELEAYAAARGVADAVVFTGHVPDGDVSALLRASDAVVLPLTAGVTPKSGALLAAFDHDCCVVATLPEGAGPLRDGEELVGIDRVRDGAAVAAALRRVLDDPGLAERVRAGGKAFGEPHAWPAIAAAHRQVYAEVLAR